MPDDQSAHAVSTPTHLAKVCRTSPIPEPAAGPGLTRDRLLGTLTTTMQRLVREGDELSTREMAVFLTIATEPGPHTVRGLAALLVIPKASITRTLDSLEAQDLVRRRPEPGDRRSVVINRTSRGALMLKRLGQILDASEMGAIL